jgi:hypothetical protein
MLGWCVRLSAYQTAVPFPRPPPRIWHQSNLGAGQVEPKVDRLTQDRYTPRPSLRELHTIERPGPIGMAMKTGKSKECWGWGVQ